MDFIEGVPRFKGKDMIMVVVDRFTKFGNFMVVSHPFITQKVA
jgi:hypothetical protein